MAELTDLALRETVRARYAAAALATSNPTDAAGCCSPDSAIITDEQADLFGAASTATSATTLPEDALIASLGCGVPTAIADLSAGDVVLDLGSGAGIDVLLSARRVGPTGTAYRPRHDRRDARARPRQPDQGRHRERPLAQGLHRSDPAPADTVDVVISNCVINLSTDKPQVLREAARVLKPGGRFAVSDVIADPDMDEATRADIAQDAAASPAPSPTTSTRATSPPPASPTSRSPRPTASTSHAGSAIIRARKPA